MARLGALNEPWWSELLRRSFIPSYESLVGLGRSSSDYNPAEDNWEDQAKRRLGQVHRRSEKACM